MELRFFFVIWFDFSIEINLNEYSQPVSESTCATKVTLSERSESNGYNLHRPNPPNCTVAEAISFHSREAQHGTI